jgi:hypothetical protein
MVHVYVLEYLPNGIIECSIEKGCFMNILAKQFYANFLSCLHVWWRV